MSNPALRQAWSDWCAFADALDLVSDGTADGQALHGRLFRLCANHPAKARHLRGTLQALRDAFDPWLTGGDAPADEAHRLERAAAYCQPGWRALFGAPAGRPLDFREVDRVARASGLDWKEGEFWTSSLFVGDDVFDPLTAASGKEHAAALAVMDALLRVLNHPAGRPLWIWLGAAPRLVSPADALLAAAILGHAVSASVLTQARVDQLGWGPLVTSLADLCEQTSLCLLRRLNEAAPIATRPVEPATPRARAARRAEETYRRSPPDPLPVEPYFGKIRGSEAFLRAAAEEPLEESHRLAFADWLEDAGQPARAELIRLQCRQDGLPAGHLLRLSLGEQAAGLVERHRREWAGGLPARLGFSWSNPDNFRRGLLECLELPKPLSEEAAGRVLAAADIRHLIQFLNGADLEAFLRSPFLPRLVRLDLRVGYRYGADVGPLESLLSRCPDLCGLALSGFPLSEDAWQALADGPSLGRLRELRLYGCGLTLGALRALAASPALANLTHLDFSGGYLQGQVLEPLFSSPWLANLRALNLGANNLSNKAAKALAASPFLTKLTSLDLSGSPWGSGGVRTEGIRALARSASLGSLQALNLSANRHLDDESLLALAEAPRLANLSSLGLSAITLTDTSAAVLASSACLAGLTALDLSDTRLSARAARALAGSKRWGNLAYLDLRGTRLAPGARAAVRERWPFALLDGEG